MDKTIIKPYEEIAYKVYGYTLPEVPNHDGYVKIGDTTRDAVTRIFEQVGTAGLNPDILFEKLAQTSDGRWFRDKDLHRFLLLNGIEKKDFNNRADEWFYFNGELEKAEELTNKFIQLDYDEVQLNDEESDYILRNEQQQAVEKTYEYYECGQEPTEFLWNAKPRFGKTLTTYDFIRNLRAKNVLIVTNRPAIANSWFDDFQKFIAWQEPQMKFVSETDALSGKAMTREEYRDFLDTTEYKNPTQIAFISLQDLKGAEFAGGQYEKLEWVGQLDWDLLVIDEAHEGIDTQKTDRAFSQIKRNFTLHLSGTPFKALAKDQFSEEQIFNWSYVDEQTAKKEWDPLIGSNPYQSLPTLNLFTYQMSKMMEDEVSAGLTIDEEVNVDYAFDLNEFFQVKDNGRFEHEASVIRFLDNLCSGKFPFSEAQYRNELNHTFWLLPRVNAAKALESLLNNHPTFQAYKVVLAAGDGVSLEKGLENEALNETANTKSFDKVRRVIEQHDKTITLSVGQLTTGVTIPEWTAVFMLNNIESPSLYFQAAFRSQNPYEFEQDGKLYRKENAYIFDFSPDRTLRLYDDFATGLSGEPTSTSEAREKKIKKLLNFFPVIAEDEDGTMHEIDAHEVLTIPTRITSREVVSRGFMSNLLFANIAGIFSGYSPFKDILEKIKPEKNKRLEKRRDIPMTNDYVNDDGEIDIPDEVSIGLAKDMFGDKIFGEIDGLEQVTAIVHEEKQEREKIITDVAKGITESVADGFDNLGKAYKLNKGQTKKLKESVNTSIEDTISTEGLTFINQARELDEKYAKDKQEATETKDEQQLKDVTEQYEAEKEKIETTFKEVVNKKVEETIQTVVEEQIEKEEETKKKTTEDDVRDHLRGFSRTIPSFLMAYGDENTTLANFEKNIDEATFEDLTSITIEEFQKLRDGFEHEEDNETKIVPGLFNEVVFNASIQEFLDTKERLANYFDESLEEDIFDYIPPQKTNQIFTPKKAVKLMIDMIEQNNPHIFKNPQAKFIDLYTKSGLYITEIVKRLNEGLKEQIPDYNERIKWIMENQVYACAPSNIIYHIVKKYIFGNLQNVSTSNLVECDLMSYMEEESNAVEQLLKIMGDEDLKFDVVIGNPPYQEMDGGAQASAAPIYHKFVNLAKDLKPEIISFIIPTRWYVGGKGLDSFRNEMLHDQHLKELHDWLTPSDIFPNTNIRGGVCYFLWDRQYNNNQNKIRVKTYENNTVIGDIVRPIKYKDTDILIRNSNALSILNKINCTENSTLMNYISARNPFGFSTNFINNNKFNSDSNNMSYPIKCYANRGRIGFIELDEIIKNSSWLRKWKVLTPYSNNIGTELSDDNLNTVISKPNTICTETYLVIGIGLNLDETSSNNLAAYMKTKFVRYLHSLAKNSQHGTRNTYRFVPVQDFTSASDVDWTLSVQELDKQLYEKYSLTDVEISHIDGMIKEM